jgi:hypothetical protein
MHALSGFMRCECQAWIFMFTIDKTLKCDPLVKGRAVACWAVLIRIAAKVC